MSQIKKNKSRARRGEYKVRKILMEQYGDNVFHGSVGMYCDYIVIVEGIVKKLVEVKSTSKNEFKPTKREKEQLKQLKKLGEKHNIPAELWIVRPYKDIKIKKLNKCIVS